MFTFLLAVLLSLPAMAAPRHCAEPPISPMAMQHDGHGASHKHHPDRALPSHDCIGCIAPLAGAGPLPNPGLLAASRPFPGNSLLIARSRAGPDSPPPRA